MDAAGLGGLATGVAALVTAGSGLVSFRRRATQDLEECRDNLGDAWAVIGLLLDLLPGGALESAPRSEVAPAVERARRRHRQRVAKLGDY